MSDIEKRGPEDSLEQPEPGDQDELELGDEDLDDADLDNSDLDEEDLDEEDLDEEDLDEEDLDEEGLDEEEAEEAPRPKLNLQVQVEPRSACERHITVTVPREDIERYYDEQFTEMMPTVQVPGFRPGRAPRKLVETRFRKEVAEKVKSELLIDSMAQVNEDENLSAISEPEIDLGAIEIPKEGPLTFEFDLEVRPDFELPAWKGLRIDRPVREFSREDVDVILRRLLANRGRLVPFDGAAERGDYLTVNLTVKHDGEVLSRVEELVVRVRPVLSFRDGRIEGFDAAMAGAEAGQTREVELSLGADAPNAALQGQPVTAHIEVLDVKRLEVPELTPELLDDLGGFELEADLRDAIVDNLQRRLAYEQYRRAREQITEALMVAADWDLPPEMLKRQSRRELERAVLELRRNGFTEEEILARENALRQHSRTATARALKEHFILERIAEEEEIEVAESDYENEIHLIAQQSEQSPRRVRARLEKSGSMDVLHNQVIERKVIEQILEHAEFRAVPYEMETEDIEAVDRWVGGGEVSDIPQAKSDKEEPTPGGRPEAPRPHE